MISDSFPIKISNKLKNYKDEELAERLRILDDAKKLKALAVAFLHPEKPVEVDPTACARCYFDRASALEQESSEEDEYRQQVLADVKALKELAADYAHPEVGVTTADAAATARCYFDRASAPEQESLEEIEYRRQVLADAAALKKLAVDYAHPEIGVVTSDSTATARCYFDHASAPEQEEEEEARYRQQVLADAQALKKLAVDYAHPELGVVTSDPTATARCYFDRASAPEQESLEEEDYRRQVLADAAALKQLAVDYAHPELGVVASDPTATARCYFDRASAPEQEDEEEAEYRQQVLADAKALKELAVDYAHPEIGVATSDPTATARCYFDRPSAPEQDSLEEEEYRQQVLADAAALKKLAIDYAHPEIGVVTSDATATARCYFDRPSAPEQESLEEEYRQQILADATALKKLAVDYAHPELGVVTSDPTATARCYFDRASAPEQEDEEEARYRQQVLADAKALKELAVDYAHPELGVVTSDPTATARCYFDRPSAPEQESLEEVDYRQQVLEDVAALKKLAVDYAHPEVAVVSCDATATARCYFDRPSAPEQEGEEEAEYRRQVLADAAALKKLAVDYAHPEIGVVTSDPTATARCYFDRASAPTSAMEDKPEASPEDSPAPVSSSSSKKTVELPITSNKTVKTVVDTSKNTSDIGRSLSSVQLYGLDEAY